MVFLVKSYQFVLLSLPVKIVSAYLFIAKKCKKRVKTLSLCLNNAKKGAKVGYKFHYAKK